MPIINDHAYLVHLACEDARLTIRTCLIDDPPETDDGDYDYDNEYRDHNDMPPVTIPQPQQ